MPSLSRSTYYRRRKEAKEDTLTKKRSYLLTKEPHCKHCGEIINKSTGHEKFSGYKYCPTKNQDKTVTEWREEMKHIHSEKKKKTQI